MNLKEICAVIKDCETFLIVTHINPEGDCLGSQLALHSILKKLNKKAWCINAHKIPQIYFFMPGIETINHKVKEFREMVDACIVLDCPSLERTGKAKDLIEKIGNIINIDHHISNSNFGKVNWVDATSSSCGEMVYQMFENLGVDMSYEDAVNLYTAIMTDTGSFKYENVSSNTHLIAAKLLEKGVKPLDIYKAVYESKTLEEIKLLTESLKTLQLDSTGQIAYMVVTKEMLNRREKQHRSTEDFVNYPRAIQNAKIAILFKEDISSSRKVQVSFRSNSEIDVNKLASKFGGGGHHKASGCTIENSLEETKKMVLKEAAKLFSV